ncbi:MAG TPA: TIGR03118 family protein, partial [Puia sp.]|nr:TIGR03118 family protein [Puia sp.]
GGKLYVCYAKIKGPDDTDDQPGAGNGYVDVYDANGNLLKRFISQGQLNSPWGIAQAPAGFGVPFHAIVVGNFGDGRINVYDSTGTYVAQLQNNGNTVVIPGLWALDFPSNEVLNADPNKLYFTAGPTDENHGVFGYLKMH